MGINGKLRREYYWLKDKVTNDGMVRSQYKDIRFILDNPKQGMEKVHSYLSDLIAYAPEHAPFYKEYAGQTFEQFPVINKKTCLDHYDLFLSDEFRDQPLHHMSTNGSTGVPFTIVQDPRKRSRVIAELKAFMYLCNLESHESMLFLDALSAKNRKKSWWDCWKENIWWFDVFQFEKRDIEQMIAFIMKHPSKVLLAYPSAMKCITGYAEKDKRLAQSGVETIITAGESLGSDLRQAIKKLFGGKCKVLSRYSNQEMGILAQESEEEAGFRLNYGSYYFECLKMDSDEPAEEDELGRIVITDLFNYAYPLIRYDTGDIGKMVRYKEKGLFPVYNVIWGKKNDILYSCEGVPVIPDAIDDMFFGLQSIEQWQIEQKSLEEFVIYLKMKNQNSQIEQMILRKFRRLVGNAENINIKVVEDIPELEGGKKRFIICNIPEAQRKTRLS